MPLLIIILLAVAIMVLGAQTPKPMGWVTILFFGVGVSSAVTSY